MSDGASNGVDASATVERLLGEAEALPDPRARAMVRALAAAMIDLVGAGLGRVIELSEAGGALPRAMADDPLVGNLLVLCGLHPDSAVVRARAALGAATAELGSIGVRLDSVGELPGAGVGVNVRVSAERGGGAQGERDRVRDMIEAIVLARAPDADAVVVELGGAPLMPAGFVSASRLRVMT